MGDADAIQATTLGLKNLERVANLLLTATTQPGEPYDDLKELYGQLLGQWGREMGHIVAIVGGFDSRQKHGGQDGIRFELVPREKQAAAVQFLNQHAFQTPTFLIKPEILRRIEPVGMLASIKGSQQRVLDSLLSSPRFARLVEQEVLDGRERFRKRAVAKPREIFDCIFEQLPPSLQQQKAEYLARLDRKGVE